MRSRRTSICHSDRLVADVFGKTVGRRDAWPESDATSYVVFLIQRSLPPTPLPPGTTPSFLPEPDPRREVGSPPLKR